MWMPYSILSETIVVIVISCVGPGLTVTVIFHTSGWLHILAARWNCDETPLVSLLFTKPKLKP